MVVEVVAALIVVDVSGALDVAVVVPTSDLHCLLLNLLIPLPARVLLIAFEIVAASSLKKIGDPRHCRDFQCSSRHSAVHNFEDLLASSLPPNPIETIV